MPTATAMLCQWTCPPLRAPLLLLVEAVDATVWTAEASVGVRHLLHAGDLAEQLAPRRLHRTRGGLDVVHPEAENYAAASLKPYSGTAWGSFSSSIVPLGMMNRTIPSASMAGARPNVSVISALVAAHSSGSRTMACQVMPSTFTVFPSRSSCLTWRRKTSMICAELPLAYAPER